MNGTKIIKALNTFAKEEWISFRKYLLMNTTEESDNYRVFAFIKKRKDKLDLLPPIESVRAKHFTELSQKSLLNILSRLYIWLEEWLVYYTLKNDTMQSDLLLVKQLNRRGLYNLADQKSKQLQKHISTIKGVSIKKSRVQSELYYNQFYSDNPIKHNKEDLFSKLIKATRLYHSESTILLETELYNIQNLYDVDYSNLIQSQPKSQLQDSLNRLLQAVKSYDLESFQEVKTELFNGIFEMGSDTHVIVTLYLQNLISRFYNITNAVTANEIYELYNYAIESGVLLNNGKLTLIRFNNLINSIAQTNSIEETSQFINKWIYFVDTSQPEALRDLSEAKNQYFHQNYSGISNAILFHNIQDPEQKIISIGFVLISLFEDQNIDYDITVSYYNNMKRTLKRNKEKLTPLFYKSCLNFIKIIALLNKRRSKTLDIDINDYHPLFFKSWAIQKIKK